jgi:F0F1-type ATP synthase epsilon subunit
MAKDIELKIYMPEKQVLDQKVYRAVLPFDDKTITVVDKRAPTLIGLDIGIIQILNEENNIVDEWFIAGGVADIKSNTCTILTEAAINRKEMDLAKIKELDAGFHNPFYKWVINFFEKEEINKKIKAKNK